MQSYSIILLFLVSIVVIYYGVPVIYRYFSEILLNRKAIKNNAVVLTYDDGPGKGITPELLKILGNNNVKATFFLSGKNIEGKEEIICEIVQQGHEICSHGYEHLNYRRMSPFKAIADIKKGWMIINSALGTENNKYPFRPPYGRMEFFSLIYLLISRIPIVYWSIDSGDTWKDLPEFEKVSQLIEIKGGGVCLLHDFERKVTKNRKYVFEATRSIINTAKSKGLSLLTMSELLANKN